MRLIALAVAGVVSIGSGEAHTPVVVTLAHDSAAEAATRSQLERLTTSYDLSPWTFTRVVVIDDHAIPHSHPILTLHTRHRRDDDLLLSTYIHEQLHWMLTSKSQETGEAIADLRKAYPQTPVGFPEGSDDDVGNYVHLLVVYLEWQADKSLLGELRAREVMEFWSKDHYTWIYRTVLDHPGPVRAALQAHGLLALPAQASP